MAVDLKQAIQRDAKKLVQDRKKLEAAVKQAVEQHGRQAVIVNVPQDSVKVSPVNNVNIPAEAIRVEIVDKRPDRAYIIQRDKDGRMTSIIAKDIT